MIVMYACKHWSKEKHKMFVQRRYMVKKMIKYISVYIIEFIFFSYSETENEKQSKIKGYWRISLMVVRKTERKK